MKGFMKDGKFHPIKNYQKIRKSRNTTTVDGIKITNNTKGKDVLNGITKSLKNQPKSVRNKLNAIIIKDKDPSEDFVARADTTNGNIIFNKKPELGEKDYEALGVHEFEHIDFNEKLESGDPKYEEFIKQGNVIKPFTSDLMATKFEQDSAFIEGNFGILPDKRLEYPDEINSVVKEIETRERLGLPTRVLDQEEFEKAKMLVDNLHKKRKKIDFEAFEKMCNKRGIYLDRHPNPIKERESKEETKNRRLSEKELEMMDADLQEAFRLDTSHTQKLAMKRDETIRKGRFDTETFEGGFKRFIVIKKGSGEKTSDILNEGKFSETDNLGEAIRLVDQGVGNRIFDLKTDDVMLRELRKRDV